MTTETRLTGQEQIEALLKEFPQLRSLQKICSDTMILSEIASHAPAFKLNLQKAQAVIPTVDLENVFPSSILEGTIRLENFLGHWGNVSIEEIAKMCLIVAWLKPKKIFEMGTYNGMSTLQLALNAPIDCQTYTIDLEPTEIDRMALSLLDRLVAAKFRSMFKTSLGSYFKGRETKLRIKQLYGDTSKYNYEDFDNQIDFVFVDAAHDYESKKTDSLIAFDLVSPNGVIVWHDYAQITNPDVTRCLAELAQVHRIWHLRNTNMAVYYAGFENKQSR